MIRKTSLKRESCIKNVVSGIVVHAAGKGKVKLVRYYRVNQFSVTERTYYLPGDESVNRLRRILLAYPCMVHVYDLLQRCWYENHEALGMYAGTMSYPAALALNVISGLQTGFTPQEVRAMAGSAYSHMESLCARRMSK